MWWSFTRRIKSREQGTDGAQMQIQSTNGEGNWIYSGNSKQLKRLRARRTRRRLRSSCLDATVRDWQLQLPSFSVVSRAGQRQKRGRSKQSFHAGGGRRRRRRLSLSLSLSMQSGVWSCKFWWAVRVAEASFATTARRTEPVERGVGMTDLPSAWQTAGSPGCMDPPSTMQRIDCGRYSCRFRSSTNFTSYLLKPFSQFHFCSYS